MEDSNVRKLIIPIALLGVVWIVLLIGYIQSIDTNQLPGVLQELRDLEKEYPIQVSESMKCKEVWDGDKLLERECRTFDYDYRIQADSIGGIKGTGSMLPFIDKGDVLLYNEVDEDDMLWTGRIYAYEKNESTTVLHRLISSYVAEDGEEYLIFKGDNNIVADKPITRDKVVRELIGVCFNGHCE